MIGYEQRCASCGAILTPCPSCGGIQHYCTTPFTITTANNAAAANNTTSTWKVLSQ